MASSTILLPATDRYIELRIAARKVIGMYENEESMLPRGLEKALEELYATLQRHKAQEIASISASEGTGTRQF